MGLLGCLICLAFAYIFFIDISNIPFSQLTFNMIGRDVLSVLLVYCGGVLLDS